MNITTENMGMGLSFFIKELHMEGEKKTKVKNEGSFLIASLAL